MIDVGLTADETPTVTEAQFKEVTDNIKIT